MSWSTGDTRQGRDHRTNPTRRLVIAVALALGSAVGAAAVDSAVKAHSGAESSRVIAATAAYAAGPAHSAPVRSTTTTPAPATTLAPAPTLPPTTTVPVHVSTPPATVSHPAPSATTPIGAGQAVASALQTRSTTPAAPALASADSCSTALAYLRANSAPGFSFECPGYALGHQAMTCVNVAGVCPGAKLIVISVVCPASYMNEAHNSWVVTGLRAGSIDPYGYCH